MNNPFGVARPESHRERTYGMNSSKREIKPTTEQERIHGIGRFWKTVSVEKCNKYINHLKKVVPRVIELEGAATGYYCVHTLI